MMVTRKEQLSSLVEKPLLSACQILYDKNIRTTGSSANKKDIGNGKVYITIDFDTLSQENKKIAEDIGKIYQSDEITQVKIEIPTDSEDVVEDIQLKAEKIANKFKKQQLLWARVYTLGDLRVMYGYDPEDEEMKIKDFANGEHNSYFYDPINNIFFESEELYRKAT